MAPQPPPLIRSRGTLIPKLIERMPYDRPPRPQRPASRSRRRTSALIAAPSSAKAWAPPAARRRPGAEAALRARAIADRRHHPHQPVLAVDHRSAREPRSRARQIEDEPRPERGDARARQHDAAGLAQRSRRRPPAGVDAGRDDAQSHSGPDGLRANGPAADRAEPREPPRSIRRLMARIRTLSRAFSSLDTTSVTASPGASPRTTWALVTPIPCAITKADPTMRPLSTIAW